MDIRIYQIDTDKDMYGLMYESYARTIERCGGGIDASVYARVFEGSVAAGDLEEVYEMFNLNIPEGYPGRPMSVSDIVAVYDPGSGETGFWFCDSVGFKKTDFDESRASKDFRTEIRVLMCEPGRMAKVVEMGTGLKDLQRAVGGMIEACYPFDEEVCIVCNDEGKLNGMMPNRAVYDEENRVSDIIFGPFFICSCEGAEFGSLTENQIEKYSGQFEYPEFFFRENGEIKAEPYFPTADLPRSR